MSKQEEAALQKKEQMEQLEKERERIVNDFEDIKSILSENGYDKQSYKANTQITIDSDILVKMSTLIQSIKQRLERVNEAITTASKYANDMLGLGSLELLDMHNDMARIHIKACEDGNTVSHEELDKEDSKV